MCGIFGSKDYKKYVALYKKNKKRGSFSFGGMFIDNKLHAVVKTQGTFNFSGKPALQLKNNKSMPLSNFKNYLGHTQAPTSSQRKYNHTTTHPFNEKEWYVAHNGVLTNHNELRKQLKKYKSVNEVDSSVIPALIHSVCEKSKKEVECICTALSLLKGTFGLWIYNSKTGNTYLARSGSTLYANYITNDFSSIPFEKFKPLEEGTLFLQTVEGLTSVGEFVPNSPFFTP